MREMRMIARDETDGDGPVRFTGDETDGDGGERGALLHRMKRTGTVLFPSASAETKRTVPAVSPAVSRNRERFFCR